MVLAAVKVSILAMGVIFIVLGTLIFVIEALIKFIPYKAPPAPAAPPVRPSAGDDEEQLAAIHAALACHLNQPPDAIHITNVRALS